MNNWTTTQIQIRCPECRAEVLLETHRDYESAPSQVRVAEHTVPDGFDYPRCGVSHRKVALVLANE